MNKTLPNKSIKWISKLSSEDAKEYKNKFISYELKNGILRLTYFLNPYQRYSRFQGVVTKKFKAMNKKMGFATYRAALLNVDRTVKNLHTYAYQVDVDIDKDLLDTQIKAFKKDLLEDAKLNKIMEVNSNKPYAVCLALQEVKEIYKELEKKVIYELNMNDRQFYRLEIIRNLASDFLDKSEKVA